MYYTDDSEIMQYFCYTFCEGYHARGKLVMSTILI